MPIPPLYRCPRVSRPVALTGRLTDPAWGKAPAVSLALTEDGRTPVQGTTARILRDDIHLYVGFSCVDRDIWGTHTKHDDPLYNEDVVEIFICPAPPRKKAALWLYYEFQLSARNVTFDAVILHPREASDRKRNPRLRPVIGWDCQGLASATHVDGRVSRTDPRKNPRRRPARGWTAELAVPFAEILGAPHTPPRNGDVWRINLYRIDHRRDGSEYAAWSPTRVFDYHVPERFGKLLFT
ncbi:MAG: carbohydrate-binding family 9-like protein [Planctomycetota bacterium]